MEILDGIYFLLSAYMTGLIWFVQVVHYPLFSRVGPDYFVAYEAQHTRRTGWVVAPVMVAELGLGLWLLWQDPGWFWAMQVGLIGALWASTFLIQVPLHARLSRDFDPGAAQRLTATNWLRTALWTGKCLLLLAPAGWMGAG